MREAYIVNAVRTPGCRRNKGALAQTRPDDLLKTVLSAVVEQVNIDKGEVEDVLCGCAFPEAEQGLNIGRIAAQMAKFPDSTTGATVNRFCAGGLEALTTQAARIMAGWCEVAIGAGVESMTIVPMGGALPRPHPGWAQENPDVYINMGMTAENVAKRYKVTRQQQDEFAYHSFAKAVAAQKAGKYKEIVPTPADRYVEKDGLWTKETFVQTLDDGVRETSLEALGKLKPAFSPLGTVTAGNSSQTTDGAAAVLLCSEDALKRLNLTPIAKVKCYVTAGCRADEMGVGPAYAIPKVLKVSGMKLEDFGLFEVNEAFASQCVYCMQQLGIYDDKSIWASDSESRIFNVNGGAIALGHPLGCTGAKLCAQLMTEMKARKVRYAIESMCMAGGMGAAAIFELC